MQRVLAVDPGTKCGWALRDGRVIMAGTWNLAESRHSGGGMRFVHLRRHLAEIGRVELLLYEEVRHHKGVDAAHVYGGVIAVLTAWAEEHGTPYEGIPVGTIKKHATGKGNADKTMMMQACRQQLRVEPRDDNEADARWLLDYGLLREAVA